MHGPTNVKRLITVIKLSVLNMVLNSGNVKLLFRNLLSYIFILRVFVSFLFFSDFNKVSLDIYL